MKFSSQPSSFQRAGTSSPQNLTGDVMGKLINLSGRRRFTSQRVVLYAVLALKGRAGALEVSREALATFEQAHAALVRGGDGLPGLYCEELRKAYIDQGADAAMRQFAELARCTHDALESRLRSAPELVDELVERATPLLATINAITQLYEDLARRQAQLVKKQLVGVMSEIESIAKQARIVLFNAQVVAARASTSGREFSVVTTELSHITAKIDELAREALRASAA